MSKAILFDRDGTLLVEVGYLNHPSLVVPYHFVPEALRKARDNGYLLIAVTNQSGVARGYLTESDLSLIHERMQDILRSKDVSLDAIYYCPHHPEGSVAAYRRACTCRKPGIALGQEAARRFRIDLESCFVIGDQETDLLFGRALDAETCLVRTGFGAAEEKRLGRAGLKTSKVFDNVLDAVGWIIEGSTDHR